MPDDHETSAASAIRRSSVLARLSLTPVLVAFALTGPGIEPWFWVVAAVRALWLLSIYRALRGPDPPVASRGYGPVLEMALVGALIAASGAEDSPLTIPLVLFPIVAGIQFGTMATARVGALTLLAFLVPAAPALLDGRHAALNTAGRVSLDVLFTTLTGIALALVRERLTVRMLVADAARRRLLNASLAAEDRERRRVSRELHAHALQELLATRQDLEEALAGDAEALPRARAGVREGVAALRATVSELHPAAARTVGLAAALRIAMQRRVAGAVEAEVADGSAERPEALLLALVRELGDELAAADVRTPVALHLEGDGRATVLRMEVGAAPGAEAAIERCRERIEAGGAVFAVGGGRTELRATIRLEAPEAEPGDGRVDRVITAAMHVLIVPVLLLYGTWSDATDGLFVPMVLVLLGVYVAGLALTLSRAWRRYPADGGVPAEMVLMGVLFAVTGGVDSDLRALVIAIAMLLPFQDAARAPALTAVLAAGFAAAGGGQILDGEAGALGQALAWGLGLVWAAVAGQRLHAGIERLRLRGLALEEARRQVLRTRLAAADAERRRLSERLHDEALQTLLVCGQELDDALDAVPGALARAQADLTSGLALLRETVDDIYPPAIEHGGLPQAIASIAALARERGGFATRVHVEPAAAGLNDELVIAVVRELVMNAVKHSGARGLDVGVRIEAPGWLAIAVDDDGAGMAPERAGAAVREGHIGLASVRERVEAQGGEFALETAPGAGVRLAVRVPLPPAGRREMPPV